MGVLGIAKTGYDLLRPLYEDNKDKIHSFLNRNFPRLSRAFGINPRQLTNSVMQEDVTTSLGQLHSEKRANLPSGGGYGFADVYLPYIKALFFPNQYKSRVTGLTSDDKTALINCSKSWGFVTNTFGVMRVDFVLSNIMNPTTVNASNGSFLAVSNDSTFNPVTGVQSPALTYFAAPPSANSSNVVDYRIVSIRITCRATASQLNNGGYIEANYFPNIPYSGYIMGDPIPEVEIQQGMYYQLRSARDQGTSLQYIPSNNDDWTLSATTTVFSDNVMTFLVQGAVGQQNYEFTMDYIIEYRPKSDYECFVETGFPQGGAASVTAFNNILKMKPMLTSMTFEQAKEFVATLPGDEVITHDELLQCVRNYKVPEISYGKVTTGGGVLDSSNGGEGSFIKMDRVLE
jgi:hypothetical protein